MSEISYEVQIYLQGQLYTIIIIIISSHTWYTHIGNLIYNKI